VVWPQFAAPIAIAAVLFAVSMLLFRKSVVEMA